jgi:hypothetical protein
LWLMTLQRAFSGAHGDCSLHGFLQRSLTQALS